MRVRTLVAFIYCFALLSCGGGGELKHTPQDVGSIDFGPPITAADVVCFGEEVNGSGVVYQFVYGVCTKMFAGMFSPSIIGPPTVRTLSVSSRASHTPLTWLGFLKWAESNYPKIFTGAAITGRSGQYQYRYYPETGHYLGVIDSGALYVMGPATNGEVLGIGTLNFLACSVYPGNCLSADIPSNFTSTAIVSTDVGLVSRVDFEGDVDLARVDLVAGRTYIFTLQGPGSGQGTLVDPYLTLYSPQGVQVASNDDLDGTGNLDSRITYMATVTGKHWLAAEAYEGVGTYKMTTSLVQAAADAKIESILWAMGSTTYRNEDKGVVLYMSVSPPSSTPTRVSH